MRLLFAIPEYLVALVVDDASGYHINVGIDGVSIDELHECFHESDLSYQRAVLLNVSLSSHTWTHTSIPVAMVQKTKQTPCFVSVHEAPPGSKALVTTAGYKVTLRAAPVLLHRRGSHFSGIRPTGLKPAPS